jgi:hypothetical protein
MEIRHANKGFLPRGMNMEAGNPFDTVCRSGRNDNSVARQKTASQSLQ